MGVQRRQLRRRLVSMALPLTVKTETVLANHFRCPLNQDMGQMIGILPKEPDPPTQIDDPEGRRGPDAMTTLIDLEGTHDASKSIMRTILQATNAALKYPMTI